MTLPGHGESSQERLSRATGQKSPGCDGELTRGRTSTFSFRPDSGAAATVPENLLPFSNCKDGSVSQLPHEHSDALGLGQGNPGEKESEPQLQQVGVRELFNWLKGKLDHEMEPLCKAVPTGKVFPLPSSTLTLSQVFESLRPEQVSLLSCVVVGLNSLNGEGCFSDSWPSTLQRRMLVDLLGSVERVLKWSATTERFSWEAFLKTRGVDYRGEEILTAQQISWANVSPALPDEVGGVPLETVCELGTQHYVLNFEDYLLHPKDQQYVKPSKVLVAPDQWEELCSNLLARGVFSKIHEDELFKVDDKPILNGLFGVSKGEYVNGVEVMRIIMNLVPLNAVCRGMEGDVSTLPTWAGMAPLSLMPEEDLVVSSEDVRCFFYIFKTPPSWHKYMAFNRPLPQSLAGNRAGRWFPCSAVLPMGFKNSVALAQHVHRWLMRRSLSSLQWGGEGELRKDRNFSTSNPLYRVYLDNFDELKRVSKRTADAIEGKVSPLVQALQDQYHAFNIPRHPKKAVSNQFSAEVQGAVVEGKEGVAFPRPEKILKYLWLAHMLVEQGEATQKQAQIVAGGLVYIAMFRRPLLCSLNAVWAYILSFEGYPPCIRLPLPLVVKREILRCMALVPLAFLDFRCGLSSVVTASDASMSGGGITVSTGLSPSGCVAAQCPVRGDVVEPVDVAQVLTVGLFDGIGALRVAADAVGWNVCGHISVEKCDQAARVVESRFPQTVRVSSVEEVTQELVQEWALKYPQVGLILLGAGPPCQGVSGLNAARQIGQPH